MRSFNMGFGGSDPWFRAGTVEVTTTVFVTAVGVLSMFVWAVEGASASSRPLLSGLSFRPDRVVVGQVWRLVTWPIMNRPDIWTLILLAVFFMLGSQLESIMGRRSFTQYLAVLVVVPPIVATLFHLITGLDGFATGLRLVEIGVLVGFALRMPNARFWPGIPAWGIAAAIVVLNLLQYLDAGDSMSIAILLTMASTSIVMLRSMGYADDAEWVPKVPLPASMGGSAGSGRKRTTSSRRKRRGRGNLSAVPAPATPPRREMSRLDEAEMDAILDQVSEQGMDSLTPQQRARLEEHAKRLRRRND